MPRLTKQRIAVIGELQKAGGVVRSKDGRAVAVLHHKLGTDTSLKALTNALSSMEEHGLIEREIRGKRTFGIRLVSQDHLQREAVREERHDGGGVPTSTEEQDVPSGSGGNGPSVSTTDVDYRFLADALLTRVAEVIDTKTSTADLQQRLADLLTDREKFRRQLVDVGDELRAVKTERDGLRTRLRQAESNIQSLLDTRNKVGLGDRQRRALERFMQARPTLR